MRLVCPSCSATYEVDPSMIPADGRDVQCAACTHVWFQDPEPTEPPLVLSTPVARAAEPDAEPAAPEDEPETDRAEDRAEDHDHASAPSDREVAEETSTQEPEPEPESEPAANEQASSGSFAERLRASMLDAEPEADAEPAEPVEERMETRSDDFEPDADSETSGASIHELPNAAGEDTPNSAEENEHLLQSLRDQLDDGEDEFKNANPRSRRRNVIEAAASAGMDTKKLLEPEKKNRLAISPDLARELKEERRAATAVPRRRSRLGFAASLILGLGVWYTYSMSATLAESYPGAAPVLAGLVDTVDAGRSAVEAGMGWATAMIAKFTA